MPTLDLLAGATIIFVLRVIGVALATVRVLQMTRGQKLLSATIGFFEVLVYVVAIGQVVQNLNNLWNIFGYCFGFFVGTLVGMWLEGRVALGFATVRIVSMEHGHKVAEAIRTAGFGATEIRGYGAGGQVSLVRTVVRRREVPAVTEVAQRADPKAFLTVEDTQTVRRGYMRIARHER